MERGLLESEEGTEEEFDRGEGTLTGRREEQRNEMEEQEEIDMEVSDNEDMEGQRMIRRKKWLGRGKGKAMENRMEENTLA
jgi:hypothetical protein